MKITIVHVVASLRDGGAEALLRGLLPSLAAEIDLNVHVVSVYDHRLDESEVIALRVPVHTVSRRSRSDISFAPRLVGKLRYLRPDIVHAHIHTGKFVGRMAAVAAGVPKIVFTEHGDESRGIVHWTMSRILNARTSRFIVFTDDERRRYALAESIPIERISVIANGIPFPAPSDIAATRQELLLDSDDFAVVVPARLAPQKNQQLALRAMAALRLQGRRRIRLIIVGSGPDADALHTLARGLDVEDAVTFLGYRTDAQRVIAACNAVALPSLWEKMPLVMGEAMLLGIPLVSAPWAGVTDFILDGQTGYVSENWSVEGFASALARLIDDPRARSAIVVRAMEVARSRFDLTQMVQSHVRLYKELASC